MSNAPEERSILIGPSHDWWHHKKVRAQVPPDLDVVPKLGELLPHRDTLGVVPDLDDVTPERYRPSHWPSNPL